MPWSDAISIGICDFNPLPKTMNYDVLLDWTNFFAWASPKQFPSPQQWNDYLIPKLLNRKQSIKSHSNQLISIETYNSLSTGFAIGNTFPRLEHYCLRTRPSRWAEGYWTTDAIISSSELVTWSKREMPGTESQTSAVIIMQAVPKLDIHVIVKDVGLFVKEQDVFASCLDGYNYNEIVEFLRRHFVVEDLHCLCENSSNLKKFLKIRENIEPDQLVDYVIRNMLQSELLHEIETYNRRLFKRYEHKFQNKIKNSQQFKAILLLNASYPADNNLYMPMSGTQAIVLAKKSQKIIDDFIGKYNPATLHLFFAVPFGLAVFLGHYWKFRDVNTRIQIYEYIGQSEQDPLIIYQKSCNLSLRV